MHTLKGWITTTCLTATLLFSSLSVSGSGGIIIGGGLTQIPDSPCTMSNSEKKEKVTELNSGGIIIGGGLVAVIVASITEIIIGGAATAPTTDCGVIIGGQ